MSTQATLTSVVRVTSKEQLRQLHEDSLAAMERASNYRKTLEALADTLQPDDRNSTDGEAMQDSLTGALTMAIRFDLSARNRVLRIEEVIQQLGDQGPGEKDSGIEAKSILKPSGMTVGEC